MRNLSRRREVVVDLAPSEFAIQESKVCVHLRTIYIRLYESTDSSEIFLIPLHGIKEVGFWAHFIHTFQARPGKGLHDQ